MGGESRLDGKLMQRQVKRLFDQRAELRCATPAPARLGWRGASVAVRIINISSSGAMVACEVVPDVGEAVGLGRLGEPPAAAAVRWVRDGRIGLHFIASVG